MNFRSLCRLTIATTAAAACLLGLIAPAAHADTHPLNTPSTPFPASFYSNGCSFPGPNALLDQHWLPDPAPWWAFYVNLRPACDMHDAGYEGGIVLDPVNGGIVDTRGMSRAQIDNMFLRDLVTLCFRQIPFYAGVALSTCHSIAFTYFGAVRTFGFAFFDANPAVPGTQPVGPRLNF